MNVWPASLPQRMFITSWQRSLGDARLMSGTDAGGGKMRRRLSYIPEPITCAVEMTTTQRKTFEQFVNVTLKGGVFPFEFPAQDDSGTWVVQIGRTMPAWTFLAPDYWSVSLDLVRLPQ